MPTRKQIQAETKNTKKAQATWRSMSHRQHALAQPAGRVRAKPGTKGEGQYYRVIVRPKEEFTMFRYHDVGKKGHLQRLAGRRPSGSWADQAWLISKDDAHTDDGSLIPDTSDARKILRIIGPVRRIKGDVFQGHPRRKIPEREKPTASQRKAQMENIRKAQAARWK